MSNINLITHIENGRHGKPVWIAQQDSLFWVEHNHQRLYQYHEPSGDISHCSLDNPILSLSPRIKNGFIATLKDGIGLFDMKSRKVIYISKPAPFSDDYESTGSIVDPKGNYWTATNSTRNDDKNQSHIYQLSSDLNVHRFSHKDIDSIAEPAFSKDGQTLYQSAKTGRFIFATTLDEKLQPIKTETFCRIPKAEGQPHGLCVDNEDNLWVCHLGGGCISCYNNSGQRISKIDINAANVLHATFGGKNLDTLFIATNGSTNSNNENKLPKYKPQDMAGCILSLKPGVAGIQAYAFSG